MTPVTCSIGNIYLFPKATIFTSRNNHWLTRCSSVPKSKSPQKFLLTRYSAISLFPKLTYRKNQILAAVETDVAVDESSSASEGGGGGEGGDVVTSDISTSITETNEAPTAQSKRPRVVRKSEMPPIKNEELVPGASFTGKVRSIQPFGAFVDFGAFTDGLVHVSRMSDSFVKDVNSVVSIGQEITVRIVEANMETGRISLTMRESDDITKLQQRKDSPPSTATDKPRPARWNTSKSNQKREDTQRTAKFVKGQVLDGTVKNLTRAGAFISLPEGEEGFLPTSEESEGFGNIMGNSSVQAGDEVQVRVLRINKGNVTLTMKKEENVDELNMMLNQGVVHVATSPFLLAFRENKDIAAFLDEREKLQKMKSLEKVDQENEEKEAKPQMVEDIKTPEAVEETEGSQLSADMLTDEITVKTEHDEPEGSSETSDLVSSPENSMTNEMLKEDEVPNETATSGDASEVASSSNSTVIDQTAIADEVKEESDEPASVSNTSNQVPSQESAVVDETPPDEVEEVSNEIESAKQPADQISLNEATQEPQASLLVEKEAPSAAPQENLNAESTVSEQNGGSVSSSGEPEIESKHSSKASTVSPALVRQLREETGAGMMDCKKALAETGGDINEAQEFLRKKGLASAEKKSSRVTAEGRIGSYIHDSRIGVLIEVNCETDFVSCGDIFRELVDDLAMQVAACPQVRYLATDDVPEETVNKEKEIEMQKEDLLTKPEQIRSKIVEGRIRKRLEEFTLLEQPYIKNDKVVVKDWVKQTIATIGENIKVRRFVRYNLGEGLEKKSEDFAAEVAAQTAAKSSSPVPKDQTATEAKPTSEKPTVTVSAALVKQLREETGAGMMDCKKALAETGGDLEKAQEYLRKKGLASADKKSSRLAAEGRISSYIHDSRIGVLIEVNCETDFVGRNEKFKELVEDLAMQVVACPQVEYVSVEDIPETMVSKEKELEMQREDLQSKPENIREKIVEGRVSKRLGELTLLEQPFIKNDSLLVKDLVKQTVAALGENIKVRRFVRFTLGEAIEEPNKAEQV